MVECDDLATKLNIDRSGYNTDDEVAKVFERATRKAFDQLTDTQGYKKFEEMKRKEEERTKSKFLDGQERTERSSAAIRVRDWSGQKN